MAGAAASPHVGQPGPRSSNRPMFGRFNRPIQRSVRWMFGRFIFGRFVGLNRPIQKRTDRFPQEPTDCLFNCLFAGCKIFKYTCSCICFYVVPMHKQLKSACAGKQPMVKRSAVTNKNNKTTDNSQNHEYKILRGIIEIMKESEGEREGEINKNICGSY